MSAHHFDPSILRAYDIRGIYQQTLTDADAFAIGLAFTACMDQRGLAKRIAVGRDGRLSSPSLAIHLIDGLVLVAPRYSILAAGQPRCSIMRMRHWPPKPQFK